MDVSREKNGECHKPDIQSSWGLTWLSCKKSQKTLFKGLGLCSTAGEAAVTCKHPPQGASHGWAALQVLSLGSCVQFHCQTPQSFFVVLLPAGKHHRELVGRGLTCCERKFFPLKKKKAKATECPRASSWCVVTLNKLLGLFLSPVPGRQDGEGCHSLSETICGLPSPPAHTLSPLTQSHPIQNIQET